MITGLSSGVPKSLSPEIEVTRTEKLQIHPCGAIQELNKDHDVWPLCGMTNRLQAQPTAVNPAFQTNIQFSLLRLQRMPPLTGRSVASSNMIKRQVWAGPAGSTWGFGEDAAAHPSKQLGNTQ